MIEVLARLQWIWLQSHSLVFSDFLLNRAPGIPNELSGIFKAS